MHFWVVPANAMVSNFLSSGVQAGYDLCGVYVLILSFSVLCLSLDTKGEGAEQTNGREDKDKGVVNCEQQKIAETKVDSPTN